MRSSRFYQRLQKSDFSRSPVQFPKINRYYFFSSFPCLSVLGVFDIEIVPKCSTLKPKITSLFVHFFVTAGYRKSPNITFYFHRGNEEDYFEIETQEESKAVVAHVRNKRRIKGPKIFLMELRGDVVDVDSGDLISRFVNRIFMFVSRYEF